MPALLTRGAKETLKISFRLIPLISLLHLKMKKQSAIWDFRFSPGYVTNVAVLPEYRRRGIAQRLIFAEFENEMDFITLEVRKSNTPAIRLYEKAGFENVGIRPHFYTSPDEDAVIMTKNFNI